MVALKSLCNQMVFPISQNIRSRRLLLRNTNNNGFLVKIIPSSLKFLSIRPLSQNHRSIYYVEAQSTVYINISLDQREFNIDKEPEEMKELHLAVYCIDQLPSRKALRRWLEYDLHPVSELVAVLNIVRSRELAVLETLLELPGKAHRINPVTRPSYGIDDSDCVTAHQIDSGTATVIPLSSDDMRELLPSDTMLRTATVVQDSWFTAVLNAFGGFYSWISQALGIIFPSPKPGQLTPTNEPVTPPNTELKTPPYSELTTPPDSNIFTNYVTKSKLGSEFNFGSRAKCSS